MSKENRYQQFKKQMERELKGGVNVVKCDPLLVAEFGSKTVKEKKEDLKKETKGVK